MTPSPLPFVPDPMSPMISKIIRSQTRGDDLVLDPFSVCGASAVEILRLGRRAVAIERDPVSAFLAKVRLLPASLPLLRWAFEDVREGCREELTILFATLCAKCGQQGTITAVERRDGKAVRIEYCCFCASQRLTKNPDPADRSADEGIARLEIPYWHPVLQLPAADGARRYPQEILNRRTAAALTIILHAVEAQAETSARDVLRAAFASALEPEGSPAAGSRNKAAVEREENPWFTFEAAFRSWYETKTESNRTLKDAVIGRSFSDLEAGRAHALILIAADPEPAADGLPEGSIDLSLGRIPESSSSREYNRRAIQAAWLRKAWTEGAHGASVDEQISTAAHTLRQTGKPGSAAFFFIEDGGNPDLHGILNQLEKNGIRAESLAYLSSADRTRRPGWYRVQAGIHRVGSPAPDERVSEAALRKKLTAEAQVRFLLHGEKTTAGNILHAFYTQLNAEQIASVSKYSIDDLLAGAVGPWARFQNGKLVPRKGKSAPAGKHATPALWRKIALEGEALAAGDREDVRLARELTLRRLEREGLTAEDAAALHATLRKMEIERHRLDHCTKLLQTWGKALGHSIRISKKPALRITWKTAENRTVEFNPGTNGILVASRGMDGIRSKWGMISYLNLERQLQEWSRNHPQLGKQIPSGLLSVEDAQEFEEGVKQPMPGAAEWKLRVAQNRKICDRHFLLSLEFPKNSNLAYRPGQFFHIECDPDAGGKRPYPLTLRRPLSIHRARYPGFDPAALAHAEDIPEEMRSALADHPSQIDFLCRVVGEGTERLSRARKGTILNAIGPCGNGFTIGEERTAVIVAGGIGIAPLAALAEWLRFCGKDVLVYIAAVEKEMLHLAVTRGAPADDDREILDAVEAEFREIGAQILTVCTDDGSLGEKGLVTEMLERGIRDGCVPRESVRLYACGPAGMLKAVAGIAERNALPCEVSLEERMACGIGACYACTTTVKLPDGTTQKKRVCREGPVFQARDIVWKD
jgi:dihydroorotate dehydrogenase electron transfer subunit